RFSPGRRKTLKGRVSYAWTSCHVPEQRDNAGVRRAAGGTSMSFHGPSHSMPNTRFACGPRSSDSRGINSKRVQVAMNSLALSFALMCCHAAAAELSDLSALEAAATRGDVPALI